ncbi:MAG: ADP-forming succinate--CoA ligase subunit beta [Alphaproteobacteria bacterium]|nr:ADP-forming succinate--CoA ligase subunit beta [Alphaproteobacteria bacterium]
MNIHEYQAKKILAGYGIPIPAGEVAETPADAASVARKIDGRAWAVKVQVHAGGRGKARGVRLVKTTEEVTAAARDLLGNRIVTDQTGPEGKAVHQVYIEQAVGIVQEVYLAALVDRSAGRVAFIGAKEGGEDIEETAIAHPDRIARLVIDPDVGFDRSAAMAFAAKLGLDGDLAASAADVMKGTYDAFIENDASLIEINPLVVTNQGTLVALDVKMVLDDNALYRHRELDSLRDVNEVDPSEVEAKRFELNYVKLGGDIGVMVNGAGLALATVDLLKERGGDPADFMDIRPVATRDQIATGFKMLLSNPKIRAILVNIYGGGILRCDTVTEGVAASCKELGLRVPLIVRTAGTNKELAEKALTARGVPVVFARDMMDAADKVIAAAKRA